ncbi:MAG TPA: glycosyltransferase [Solirubrobacteraceae bacterium]|nr:glycosyltransferase [Solirubrobacteraceae bacterium]
MSAPDVIVGWLQNDYGQLGRAGEAVAHALVRSPEVGRVAYVEPFQPAAGEPQLGARDDRGLLVFSGSGSPPTAGHEVARGVVQLAELKNPVLLNFGVSEVNWWLHYEFAPLCSRTVLVAYDKLAQWDVMAPRKPVLERVRAQLIAASDAVCGLSQGSIDDVPDATYVGHGVDEGWHDPSVDALPEPADLAGIPHPRAVYVGALSMRFDVEAVRALADAGVEVVLVGMAPGPELIELVAGHSRVHLIGERRPAQAAAYLIHCDVGIVPHTDEPFTYSMEPHKAYNYAAAGLPTVTLNTAHAPALGPFLNATRDRAAFVAGVQAAIAGGRLSGEQVATARSFTWERVATGLLAAADGQS